jgi:hypothetical protein
VADPSDELTVLELVAQMREAGFVGDAFAAADGVRCGSCRAVHAVEDLDVEKVGRVEGISDPDDEAIVLGLRCRSCGVRSVLVAGYGPTASPEDAAVVAALQAR